MNEAGRIVYPPVCAGCGVFVGVHGGVCPECWSSLNFIEAPVCDVLGLPLQHAIGDQVVSPDALADPPPFEKARAAVLYDGIARSLAQRLKYGDRTDLAVIMARWMARAGAELIQDYDAIAAVPLHRWRLLRRQFNQSAELARQLATMTGLPYNPGALVRKKSTRPQVGLPAAARLANVQGAFVVPPRAIDQVAGRSIILVDDVYTTGATVKAATKSLLKAGADRVAVLTFARVAAGPL